MYIVESPDNLLDLSEIPGMDPPVQVCVDYNGLSSAW